MTPNARRPKASGVVLGIKEQERLTSFITRFLGIDTKELVMVYKGLFLRIERCEGTLNACIRAKRFYDIALRYAAGLKVTPIPYTRSDREGFPKALKAFKNHLSGNLSSKRAALTILQLYKLKESKADFSTESITNEYGGSFEPWWLVKFDQVLQKEFPPDEIQDRIDKLRPRLHVSGKKGPNGPALITSPVDREAIRGTELEYAILQLVRLTGNIYADTLLDESSDEPLDEVTNSKGERPIHSRIRIKYEPGGKARAFCICDYFSQSALSPIHEFLMDWLKCQPEDGTNNHSNAAQAVKTWTDGRFGNDIWSFDLTTATDRYPRFLEKRVITAIFGEEIAHYWEIVISDREFLTPDNRMVRFAVGQPLGALSSWAAFAVTHHCHIRTAASIVGKRPIYRIIGDDITIARDPFIAQLYISMMSDLDVPFSGPKSILPEQMGEYPVAELAKRVFCNGSEITPIPPDAILEGTDSPIGLKNLLEIAIDRGYDRASQIYPVQSAMPSQAWYPTLTFPVRNRLPQLNEVKVAIPYWEDITESPPMGINPGWFIWNDFSYQELSYFLRELLLIEVKASYEIAIRYKRTLYEWSLIGPDDVGGGDWKPEPWDIHMFMLPRIVDYMLERLEEVIEDIRNVPSIDDPYAYIGGLHSFLDPRQAFQPHDFRDEKTKTKVFISQIIKKIEKVCKDVDPIGAIVRLQSEEV